MDSVLDLPKFERIELLKRFNLNVPFMTMAHQNKKRELQKAFDIFIQERPGELVSIRTYLDDAMNSYHCPFHPFMEKKEAWAIAKTLNPDFHIIFTEGVDPRRTIICGNVTIFAERINVPKISNYQLHDQPLALFEFIMGPGTVRDMRIKPVATLPVLLYGHTKTWFRDHSKNFPEWISQTLSHKPPGFPNLNYYINSIQKVLRKVRKFPYAYKYIVEWGVSDYKVGVLHENVIFWEVR